MLLAGSALKGYAIEASDGRMGKVSDVLFDDTTWKLRWMVVDTGTWLKGRKVLVHPSALGEADYGRQELRVHLSRAQVEGSPNIATDQPVSRQMQDDLYGYYGWDPVWGGGGMFGGYPGLAGMTMVPPSYHRDAELLDRPPPGLLPEEGDPHLRSLAAVTGYHVHALDGDIGHVQDVLVDDAAWAIRYVIVDTSNWWFGQHVLVSPFAVREVSWSGHEIRTGLTRGQVKASPPWDPAAAIDQAYGERLHSYYGWPAYEGGQPGLR